MDRGSRARRAALPPGSRRPGRARGGHEAPHARSRPRSSSRGTGGAGEESQRARRVTPSAPASDRRPRRLPRHPRARLATGARARSRPPPLPSTKRPMRDSASTGRPSRCRGPPGRCALGRDRGGLGEHQATPPTAREPRCTRCQSLAKPSGAVLAHRRDADAVAQRDAAQGEGVEEGGHGAAGQASARLHRLPYNSRGAPPTCQSRPGRAGTHWWWGSSGSRPPRPWRSGRSCGRRRPVDGLPRRSWWGAARSAPSRASRSCRRGRSGR